MCWDVTGLRRLESENSSKCGEVTRAPSDFLLGKDSTGCTRSAGDDDQAEAPILVYIKGARLDVVYEVGEFLGLCPDSSWHSPESKVVLCMTEDGSWVKRVTGDAALKAWR